MLACGDTYDAVGVINESAGRSAANVDGVETRGAASIVLASSASRRPASGGQPRDAIDAMIDYGWYVAPNVYTKIVGKLESLGD